MEFVAVKDTDAKSDKPAELQERYGLTAEDIERAVRSVIKRKYQVVTELLPPWCSD